MTMPASFQFLHPLWLLLLPPLWVLIWKYARNTRPGSMWQQFCDPHLLAAMTTAQRAPERRRWAPWIIGSVLSIGIIALAGPSWSRLSYPIMEATSARVLVFDLSRSMLVEDVKPNRYQHALAAAAEIIDDDFSGETGLVVFAQSAFVLSPLSRDADSLLAFLEAVGPETMPGDGSNLASGISAAADLLRASLSGQGQILLVTAGDSSDQTANRVAAAAAQDGNRVSVLAIGSAAGGPLLDLQGGLQRDEAGLVQISKTNYSLLQSIVSAGKGSMASTGSAGFSADLLSSRIDASELVESEREASQSEREAANDGVWLVWLMLPLALLLFRRNLLWVLLLVVVLPLEQPAHAGEEIGLWQHPEVTALAAYRRGDYQTADAVSNNPMMRGASRYRKGNFTQALQQFETLESAAGRYNYANTLVQLQRYSEAIEGYRDALELDPKLQAARYNLRLLELFMQQQSESSGMADDSGDPNAAAADPESGDAFEVRIGDATDMQTNPADEQQLGPGSGAAQQAGQVDPLERFDGEDLAQERFILRAQGVEQAPQQEFIERWINSLPETSTELYRRKFLRDFRRQQLEQR